MKKKILCITVLFLLRILKSLWMCHMYFVFHLKGNTPITPASYLQASYHFGIPRLLYGGGGAVGSGNDVDGGNAGSVLKP